MFKKPYLAKVEDRSRKASINAISGDPFDWFNNATVRGHSIGATTFDFFVDWGHNSIPKEIWHKILYDANGFSLTIKDTHLKGLIKDIVSLFGKEYVFDNFKFETSLGLKSKYVLIPDITINEWENEWDKPTSDLPIIIFNPTLKNRPKFLELYNVHNIVTRIKELRGESEAKMGKKGMMYATSALEGFLSKGKVIWPGDVDLLLYNVNQLTPIAMIEIKKHTNHDPRLLGDLSIRDYISVDQKKYSSLYLFSRQYELPFYMLYYSTNTEDTVGYIERINTDVSTPMDMGPQEREKFILPHDGDGGSYEVFFSSVISSL